MVNDQAVAAMEKASTRVMGTLVNARSFSALSSEAAVPSLKSVLKQRPCSN